MNRVRWGIIAAVIAISAIVAIAIRADAGSAPPGTVRGGRTLFESTAYCETGDPTASGKWPREGVTVAVDPDIIPLGSAVLIWDEDGEWMGIYEAQDTGGAIDGYILDIYMDGEERCWKYGRRPVWIQVIPGAVG